MSLLGREEPRVFTPPLRELTPQTSLGFLLVEFSSQVCGVELLPWQRWLAIHALELRRDGSLRFRVVLALVARQNGKSTFSQVLILFFLYVLRVALVVGTAQNLDIAEEIWEGVVAMAESSGELSREVARVARQNGKKALQLAGGGRYLIKAATRRGSRGVSADLVVLDELREQQTWDAWGAVAKTTLARPDALVFCITNAGDATSVVLRRLRATAHAALGDPDGVAAEYGALLPGPDEGEAEASSTGLFEWSAPDGCALRDRAAWAMANPSLGHGFLTERALAAAAEVDEEAVFRTECLCQEVRATVRRPFPDGAWEAGLDPASSIPQGEPLFFGLDMSADRKAASLAVCGRRADGSWHVEVIARQGGHAWAVDALRRLAGEGTATVAMQGRGAAVSSYADEVAAADGVDVVTCEGRDLTAWCGRFYDAVCAAAGDGSDGVTPVFHLSQPVLDEAAGLAQRRELGDGGWAWDRRASACDISPLVSCTMAFGLATRAAEAPVTSAYEERGLVVI